jgi:ribonuclease D
VQRPPVSPEELNRRSGVSSRVARKHSARIVSIISEARKQDVSILEAPQRNNWKSPGRAAKLLLEMLRLWRNEKAKELNLQIGVVFPASLLEHVAATPPANMGELAALPGMRQWRVQEFGAELLQLLRNGESQIASPEAC